MSRKVLVVEDNDFTRLSIANTLSREGFDVYAARSASDAATHSRSWFPDIAVLDLHLGQGPTGIDLAKLLRKDNPRIGIVLLTSYEDPRMLNSSLPALPAGTQYLTKQSVTDSTDLLRAMAVSITSHVVKPTVTDESVLRTLTDHQHDILRLVAEGYSNHNIALQLGRTTKAVESSIKRLAKALELPASGDMNQRVLLTRMYLTSISLQNHRDINN